MSPDNNTDPQPEQDTAECLTAEDLQGEEHETIAEHAMELAVLMAGVYQRRGARPFNYDGAVLLLDPKEGQKIRVHLHMCVHPTDESDEAVLDFVAAGSGARLQ